MKRAFLTFAFAIFSTLLFSQEFTYKRVITSSTLGEDVLRLKGTIKVTDSIITITTNGVPSKMPVILKKQVSTVKNFIVPQPDDSDYEIRITFSTTPFSKKETAFLLFETKDYFKNTMNTLMYPLIPLKKD